MGCHNQTHTRPGPDHSPPLAPEIPRSPDLIKSTMRDGKGLQLRKRSLTGCGPRSIDIHHDPMLAQPIPQAPWGGERLARHEIFLKERPQCLHTLLIKRSKKAREG